MTWRKAVVAGVVALLLLTPNVVCAQQAGSGYTVKVDATLAAMKEVSTTHHDFGHVEIFTNVDETIPPHGPENLVKLVDVIDGTFQGWTPTEDNPLRVYVWDYETYREFGERFNEIYADAWKQSVVEETRGFFIPLATGEYAYVVYGWDWFVHLHEMFHIALTSHVSLLTGTNHGAVDPEVLFAWRSPAVEAIVDAATKGVAR